MGTISSKDSLAMRRMDLRDAEINYTAGSVGDKGSWASSWRGASMTVTMGERDYTCFGLRIRSLIELPELALPRERGDLRVGGDESDRPHVHIKFGAVPLDLPGLNGDFQVGGGEVLLRVAGTARYLIRSGREITVDADPNAAGDSVRLYLLGSAFGILCHQRGLFPLHANAIVTEGGVVAFAGDSGAGKSTLAAYFQNSGYEVLCDDVCALSFDAGGRPLAWPGLPGLRLRSDAVSTFGYDSGSLQRAGEGSDKHLLPFPNPSAGPFAFHRLYILEVAAPGLKSGISTLQGAAAYQAVSTQTYRHQFLQPMGLRRRHLRQSAALLQHAKVFSAPRGWGFDIFSREAAKLERHFKGN